MLACSRASRRRRVKMPPMYKSKLPGTRSMSAMAGGGNDETIPGLVGREERGGCLARFGFSPRFLVPLGVGVVHNCTT